MTAYIIRRLLFMVPTIFGIMLVSFVVVQFAPGGPVERIIAQLSGVDTGARARAAPPAAISADAEDRPAAAKPIRSIAGLRGLIPNSSKAWKSNSASIS